MNKTKLEIIEMLWDLVDKELKFGCLFKYEHEWRDATLMLCSIYDDTWMTETLSYLSESREMTYELNNYDNCMIWEELKIIWQYHLWTILMWLIKNVEYNWWYTEEWELSLWIDEEWEVFAIDADKPPMSRDNQQDQELLNFMKKVSWNKD